MKVLLDTNGLLMIRWVDIFSELERLGYDKYLVPEAVLDELEALRKTVRGEDKVALNLASSIHKRCKII